MTIDTVSPLRGEALRVGPLTPLPDVLAKFGLTIEPLLAEAGLPNDALSSANDTLSAAAAGQLLEICAERANCPHIGLMLGALSTCTPLFHALTQNNIIGARGCREGEAGEGAREREERERGRGPLLRCGAAVFCRGRRLLGPCSTHTLPPTLSISAPPPPRTDGDHAFVNRAVRRGAGEKAAWGASRLSTPPAAPSAPPPPADLISPSPDTPLPGAHLLGARRARLVAQAVLHALVRRRRRHRVAPLA